MPGPSISSPDIPIPNPNSNSKGSNMKKPSTTTSTPTTQNEVAVQGTNDSSIVSKVSMQNLGYTTEPQYLEKVVLKPTRRAPLINRGYYIRVLALKHLMDRFLEADYGAADNEVLQIVCLGCGFDPSFFRLQNRYNNNNNGKKSPNFVYYDIDFPDLVNRKSDLIRSQPDLVSLLGDNYQVDPSAKIKEIHGKRYHLIGCDLRQHDTLTNKLTSLGLDFSQPTFILAECVFTYMPPTDCNPIIEWVSKMFSRVTMALYEQILPPSTSSPNITPFARTMLKHFVNLQSRLQCIDTYPTLRDQCVRFEERQWDNVEAVNLNSFWMDVVDEEERLRVLNLEYFDEWEEWHIKCGHYFMLSASKGIMPGHGFGINAAPSHEGFVRLPSDTSNDNSNSENVGALCPFTMDCHTLPAQSSKLIRRHQSASLISDNRVVMCGGYGYGLSNPQSQKPPVHNRLNETSIISLKTGEMQVISSSSSPKARIMAAMHTLPGTDLVILFGGRDGPKKVFRDVWSLNGQTHEWTCLGEWELLNRFRCASCVVAVPCSENGVKKCRVYGFGGMKAAHTVCDDGFIIECTYTDSQIMDIQVTSWKNEELSKSPVHSASLVAIPGSSKLLLTGGIQQNEKLVDANYLIAVNEETGAIDIVELVVFKHFRTQEPLTPRYGHASVSVKDNLIALLGGVSFPSGHASNVLIDLTNLTWWTIHDEKLSNRFSVGSSVLKVSEDRVVMIGGGGTCFSMGSCWDEEILVADIISTSQSPETIPERAITNWSDIPSQEPIVLTGVNWGECTQKWKDVEYLSTHGPSSMEKVSVHVSDRTEMDFISKNFKYEFMAWSEFIQNVFDAENPKTYYLRALSSQPRKKPAILEHDFPSLAKDVVLDDQVFPVASTPFRNEELFFSSVLRISSQGLRLWTHYDVMDNILINIVGRKKVILWHPKDIEHLNVKGSTSQIVIHESPEGKISWTGATDAFERIWRRRKEVILEEGECLVLPSMWFHNVVSLTPAISLNMFYRRSEHLSLYSSHGKDLYGNKDLNAYERCEEVLEKFIQASLKPMLEDGWDSATRKRLVREWVDVMKRVLIDNDMDALRIVKDIRDVKSSLKKMYTELKSLPEVERWFYTWKVIEYLRQSL